MILSTARVLTAAVGMKRPRRITRIARVVMDIDGWKSTAAFYVVLGLTHDVILGSP